MSRAVVEACLRLDIRELNRRGWRFGWHAISYSTSASISLRGTIDCVKLSYRVSEEPLEYEVHVVDTSVHFGGRREWFLCPDCERRCAVLYIADRRFRCRSCNGLAYRTQHEKPDGRLLIKAERLWKRAGCEFGGDDAERPKGMHRSTFSRLMGRAEEAYAGSWNTPRIARMLAKASR